MAIKRTQRMLSASEGLMRAPIKIEQRLRDVLTSPQRHTVQQAIGWDDSQVSRFLSGQQGIPLNKIDALISAVSFVCVTVKYLDAITTLGEVGVHCACARAGHGECGK